MIDREKVIKKAERIMCSTVDRDMIDSFCEDVIELLKEQETVKLHTIDTDEKQYSFWFVCGNCGWKIYKVVDDENCEDRKQIHFCASCGRPISWGGR